ncbi:hypothetical protein ABZ807_02640 [Micromonospora sp. NPDC047548]|uniref:hypothetical protein n=1 Tax=Micromonospora sp. NPDC047548 TaxID=3155624 RepID=UPI0033EDF2D3
MSLTRNAEATAARTADSRWLELLARAGFLGYQDAGQCSALQAGGKARAGRAAEQGRERVRERIASAGRTVVYLYFASTAVKVLKDAGPNSADQQEA